MRLDKIYNISNGILKTRIEEVNDGKDIGIFTKEHFDLEFGRTCEITEMEYVKVDPSKYIITKVGDVLIDSLTAEAIIITKQTAGLLVLFNYFVLNKIQDSIDDYYFINWFNNSTELKRQLNVSLQGSAIKKISLSQLSDLKINVDPPNLQKNIGGLYKNIIEKEKLLNKKNVLLNLILKDLANRKDE